MRKNSKFSQRLKSIPDKLWTRITQIDELKGEWTGGARLNPQLLGRLKKSVLVTSTGASTRIEGAKLTDEEIEKLIRGISIQRFSDRDKQEVQGYYELLQNVFDSWKQIRFSEGTIKHFHKDLLKFVEKDALHRGEYKKRENKVHMINEAGESIGLLFDTTPAYLTQKEMLELVEWTQTTLKAKKYHPLLIVGNFLVEFLKIHPFQDGNGRLSRILTNLLLLQTGYNYIPYISHEKLIEDNKADYYVALRSSQKTMGSKSENILPWLEFFFGLLLTQAKMAVELLSDKNIEKQLTQKQLRVWEYLKNVKDASPSELSIKTKVARPTINQVLDKLLLLKKIERIGLGRGTRYRVL